MGRRMFRISRTSLALCRRPTQTGDHGSLLIYRLIVPGPCRREWIGKTLNPRRFWCHLRSFLIRNEDV